MLNRKLMMQQQQPPVLFNKGNSNYRKLEKAMKEPAREYEQIKKLVDAQQSLASIREENGIEKNKIDIKLIPHQNKNNINIKSKK